MLNYIEHVLENFKGEYRLNHPLSAVTWFKVGGPAKLLVKPYDVSDLCNVIRNNNNKMQVICIGAGSNIIIRDKGVNGIVVKLGRHFSDITQIANDKISVGAGCSNFALSQFCLKNSISGFEFLSGIPGTIGGGIVMNAGAYGSEFKDIVTSVEGVDRFGNVCYFNNEQMKFGYRNSIFLKSDYIIAKAEFVIKPGESQLIKEKMQIIHDKRSQSQPIGSKTGGSTFANPQNCKAWELIEKAGLRGYQIGGAAVSDLHCNFLLNLGNATATDLESLGEFVRKTVFEKTGILLEWEIQRIGEQNV